MENTNKNSGHGIAIAFIIFLVLGIGSLLFYFLYWKPKKEKEAAASSTPSATTTDPNAQYVPPTAPEGTTVAISELDQLMSTNMPWAENPKVLTGQVPIVYSTILDNVHINNYVKLTATAAGVVDYPGGQAYYETIFGSGSSGGVAERPRAVITKDYLVGGTSIKMKDIIWGLDYNTDPHPGTSLWAVAKFYRDVHNKIFPFVSSSGAQVRFLFPRNQNNLEFASKELTQTQINNAS